VRDAWREEVEAVVDMHLDARASLAKELTGHRLTLETTRDAHQRLQSVLAEKDGAAESLRQELDRLGAEAGATREAHDRLQALLAERGGNEESLRQELDRLSEDAAAARQSHDKLEALIAEKERTEKGLWQELERLEREAEENREVRDRLQAALADREKLQESLRQEQERRQAEEAARREAEEAHGRHQGALAAKEQNEESLRRDMAHLQDELGEHQKAGERLRGENEFLAGVIDGSPAGIFAHDRDGHCRVWNAAMERLLGRPRADALGRTAAELFPAANGKPRTEDLPAVENGLGRAEPATVTIGRSELLETAHAPVRDSAGEVLGEMALVRVLPMAAPIRAEDELSLAAEENGRRTRPAPLRLADIDWLGFN
jgi:PAS domain S-box-containing protein